jgi:SAM-dependent methyltransferase
LKNLNLLSTKTRNHEHGNREHIQNFSKQSKLYNNLALVQRQSANYLLDYLSSSNQHLKELIIARTELNMLDLGAGTGFIYNEICLSEAFSKIVAKTNYDFYEIDLSLAMLKKRKAFSQNSKQEKELEKEPNNRNINRAKHYTQINADFCQLPLLPDKFNIIFSNFALHWVELSGSFWRNLANFCARDGLMFLAIPVANSLSNLAESSLVSGCNFSFYNFPAKDEILQNITQSQAWQVIDYQEKTLYQENLSGVEAIHKIKNFGGNISNINTSGRIKSITKKQIEVFNNLFLANFKLQTNWEMLFLLLKNNKTTG